MHFIDKYELLMFAKRFNLERGYIETLKKDQISIIRGSEEPSVSKIGGSPLLPKNFKIPKDSIFLAQFDLSLLSAFYPVNINDTSFPRVGLLSIFINSHSEEFYEEDFLYNPCAKIFYFNNLGELGQSQFMGTDVDQFTEQLITYEKSCSMPKIDFNPEFEILNEYKDLYYKFESEMIQKEDRTKLSNFFGWSQNRQPVRHEDYEKIQKFYKTKSNIVHLFTFTNDFDLEIQDVTFESISIFILEEDLINGKFDRVWMIPCFD